MNDQRKWTTGTGLAVIGGFLGFLLALILKNIGVIVLVVLFIIWWEKGRK